MLAVLDPLLAAPHTGQSGLDIDDHVSVLVAIHEQMRAGRLSVLISSSLYETLSAEGLYPLRDAFEQLLAADPDVQALSGNDVARIVLTILQRAAEVESTIVEFTLEECVDNSDVVLPPACSCHPGMQAATIHILQAAGALRVANPARAVHYVASVRSSSDAFRATLRFGEILCFDDREIDDASTTLSLPIARSPEAASGLIDAVATLQNVHLDRASAYVAINAALAQQGAAATRGWQLHPEFVRDISSPDVRNRPALLKRVLRACVEVILDSNLGASHALRVGAGASMKQREVGGWKAWRQDVDHEWHMHFWRSGTGEIQFASMRVHNYVGVPDPHGV